MSSGRMCPEAAHDVDVQDACRRGRDGSHRGSLVSWIGSSGQYEPARRAGRGASRARRTSPNTREEDLSLGRSAGGTFIISPNHASHHLAPLRHLQPRRGAENRTARRALAEVARGREGDPRVRRRRALRARGPIGWKWRIARGLPVRRTRISASRTRAASANSTFEVLAVFSPAAMRRAIAVHAAESRVVVAREVAAGASRSRPRPPGSGGPGVSTISTAPPSPGESSLPRGGRMSKALDRAGRPAGAARTGGAPPDGPAPAGLERVQEAAVEDQVERALGVARIASPSTVVDRNAPLRRERNRCHGARVGDHVVRDDPGGRARQARLPWTAGTGAEVEPRATRSRARSSPNSATRSASGSAWYQGRSSGRPPW